MRHGRGALLPRREKFLRLQHFGALQMADFGRQPLDRGGDDAERGEIHGVAIARDDLGRDRLDAEPHFLRHMGFDPRIDLREGADRARNRGGRDLVLRRRQAFPGAGKFGIGVGELEPERRRLGVDAVRAADGRRVFVFLRARLQRRLEPLHVGDEQIGRAHELHVQAGVEHVGGGHALMHEARLRPDDFRQVREEGDDIVLGLALDLVDARRCRTSPSCLFPRFSSPPPSGSCRARPWRRRRAPRSRTRCESASRGDQISAISGRE